MADYKINQNGEIIWEKDKNGIKPDQKKSLWFNMMPINNINDEIEKSQKALNAAKEKIKRQMIDFDKSPDNSVVYTALTNFNKENKNE